MRTASPCTRVLKSERIVRIHVPPQVGQCLSVLRWFEDFRSILLRGRLSAEQIQHRHADGQAVGDLLENRGVRTVGDLGRDLDAAVDRSGSKKQYVRLGQLE